MKTLRLPNDCGVVAIRNLLNVSYHEARQICFLHGFSSVSGIPIGAVEFILEQKGFQLVCITRFRLQTLSKVSEQLDKEKNYIIEVRSHIMAQVKGVLINVAGTEKRRVEYVYEVLTK